MSMSEIISLLPALFAGAVLGLIFFGGLWLTIEYGLRSRNSGLIFFGSFIFRMAIVLLGFYYVGANSWPKMLVCLLGFLVTRFVLTRMTANRDPAATERVKEANDET